MIALVMIGAALDATDAEGRHLARQFNWRDTARCLRHHGVIVYLMR
jgi:hypothetical protein